MHHPLLHGMRTASCDCFPRPPELFATELIEVDDLHEESPGGLSVAAAFSGFSMFQLLNRVRDASVGKP